MKSQVALAHAAGKLAPDEPLVCESVLGGQFEGRLVGQTEVGAAPAVIPQITGRAWITGMADFVLDPTDVFPQGFAL